MVSSEQQKRNFSNFSGVLSGLYHQDPARMDNPMKQPFVEAVDKVTYEQQLVENNLRNRAGLMDPIKLTQFMQSVGAELDVDPVLIEDLMNDMALAEIEDLQEESDGYEIGGDEPLDIPSMQHEWFVEGYEKIHGVPFDAKEMMRQVLEESRYDEPVEQEDPMSFSELTEFEQAKLGILDLDEFQNVGVTSVDAGAGLGQLPTSWSNERDEQKDQRFSNFKGVLHGMYYQDTLRVDGNPMVEPFAEAVDKVTYAQRLLDDDLRNIAGEMSPQKLTKFIQDVGAELKLDPDLINDTMIDMGSLELHDLQEESAEAVRNGDEPLNIARMQNEWFVDGYEKIYNEPFDAKESMRQHVEEERRNELIEYEEQHATTNDKGFLNLDHALNGLEPYKPNKPVVDRPIEKSYRDGAGMNLDYLLEPTTEKPVVSDKPIDFADFQAKLDDIEMDQTDSLMNVSLNAPLSQSAEPELRGDHQHMIDFVNQVRDGEKSENMDKEIKNMFEKNVNALITDWDVHTTDFESDPKLFNDWLAQVVAETDKDLVADPDDAISGYEAYTVLNKSFGPNMSKEHISEFAQGYARTYDVPMDAYQMDMDEVNVEMGLPPIEGARGMVKYKDVMEAESKEDMQVLIDTVQRTIDDEERRDFEAGMDPEPEPEDDGPEF